ncbi:MAG: rhomboid family intramembrane serine protease [Deltaproteobacteria bacterium]|nr:MAG: rhomboid family intramembrane serine protease [Deltaproteobacteria bacterium]
MIPVATTVRPLRPPIVTGAIIFICVWAFLVEVGMPQAQLEAFIQQWGLVPARHLAAVRQDPFALQAWLYPLVFHMFLHGGWLHLIGNMLYLWVFGGLVENRLGHGRFGVFYFLSGIAAAHVQVFFSADSTTPMLGASGAIAGVVGAALVLYPLARVVMLVPVFFYPLFFEIPVLFFAGFWFIEQLVAGTFTTLLAPKNMGGVAWWAHAGGFLAGILLLPLLLDRKHEGYRPPSYRAPGHYARYH